MRTPATSTQRPFGIEYLEPIQVPPRGGQADCCTTYNSTISFGVNNVGNGIEVDTPTGSPFCDDSDNCMSLAG